MWLTGPAVQRANPELPPPDAELASPYSDGLGERFDNGNTIIIFDNSGSQSIHDTLVPARGSLEARWRRLPFYLLPLQPPSQPSQPLLSAHRSDGGDGGGDGNLAVACMQAITADVFKAIADCWEDVMDAAWEHVSILEDQVFEQPADESRAPELWSTSAMWLKFEKLMYGHQDAAADLRRALASLDGDLTDEASWLPEASTDLARVGTQIEEDLVKRTANLADLVCPNPSGRVTE